MAEQCAAISGGSGKQCQMKAEDGYPTCLHHAEEPERQERRHARHSQNGYLSGVAKRQRQQEQQAAALQDPPSLRTPDDLFRELGEALVLVKTSAGDAIPRATAIKGIVEVAHKILQGDLAGQTVKLEQLIAKHPELARHLKAVK
jgi:hypothetical protein